MGPIWGRQDPGGSYVGPMNFAIWDNFQDYKLLPKCQWKKKYVLWDATNLLGIKKLN